MAHLWNLLAGAAGGRTRVHLPWGAVPEVPLDQVLDRAERTAAGVVRALGRVPGRVGLLMGNGEPWLRGLLAILRLDATAVPLGLPHAADHAAAYRRYLRQVAADTHLEVVLTDSSAAPLAGFLRHGLPGVDVLDVRDAPPRGRPPGEVAGGDGDLALVLTTPGTTSAPKAVALSHANVSAGLRPVTDGVDWRDGDAMGVWLPLSCATGLYSVLASLARGSGVCLWSPADFFRRTRAWLSSFAASPATVCPAPDAAYDVLLRSFRNGPPPGLDLSRWRVAYDSGAAVHAGILVRLATALEPAGLDAKGLLPAYGLTEATPAVTVARPHRGPRTIAVDRHRLAAGAPVHTVRVDDGAARFVTSVGRPAGVGLRLVHAGGEVPDGTVGEIEVRGAAVMQGYLGEEAQPFSADGWLRTGDLAFREAGEIYVVGRRSEAIAVGGRTYDPEDVEDLARRTPGADRRQCVAGATGHGVRVLLETAREGAAATDLARAVRRRLVAAFDIDEVEVVAVAPRTIPYGPSGSIRRPAARSLLGRCAPDHQHPVPRALAVAGA